jgi:hypothetical protein
MLLRAQDGVAGLSLLQCCGQSCNLGDPTNDFSVQSKIFIDWDDTIRIGEHEPVLSHYLSGYVSRTHPGSGISLLTE